jgi:hypothetical protein
MAKDDAPGKCHRCGGTTQEGFLLDEGYISKHAVRWVAGPPEQSFFSLKLRGRALFHVEADRCLRCGRLELYARQRDG